VKIAPLIFLELLAFSRFIFENQRFSGSFAWWKYSRISLQKKFSRQTFQKRSVPRFPSRIVLFGKTRVLVGVDFRKL
jgi:hypothetical protein